MPIQKKESADLDAPSLSCGNCHFTSAVAGSFAVEHSRLVFRADPDPQPRRGPDFSRCGECGTEFSEIRWDWGSNVLDGVDDLLDTADRARQQEWDDWQEEP